MFYPKGECGLCGGERERVDSGAFTITFVCVSAKAPTQHDETPLAHVRRHIATRSLTFPGLVGRTNFFLPRNEKGLRTLRVREGGAE